MRRILALTFAAGLTLTLAACVTPVAGPEFPVNTTTTGTQSAPAVASVGPDSNFVIVWSGGGAQDGDQTGIFGRMFDASGAPLGGEFLVNTVTAGYQDLPNVASNSAGNFVVAWTHLSGSPGYEIRARRFDPSGTPQGVEIVVNTFTTGSQVVPDVAIDAAGNFVVVWASGPGQDGDAYGVFGRRFDANGNPLGGEFQINEETGGSQGLPRIAMGPAGDFIVAWESPQDLSDGGVVARRYGSNGNPLGGEFLVNRTEEFAQGKPDVALDAAGNAIIVWTSYAQDGDGDGIYGQRLDPSGNKIGPEFNINTITAEFQGRPGVAASPSPDRFTVTWQSNNANDPGIASQEFDQTGRRSMMEFPVNGNGTGAQIQPAIAAQPNGQFVIVWASEAVDADFGISARVGGFPRVEFTRVDVAHSVTGSARAGASNLNGMLEVGEHVNVEPAYRNLGTAPLALTETLTSITGFPGPTYSIDDDTADYGTLDPDEIDDCFGNAGGCFTIGVVGTRRRAARGCADLRRTFVPLFRAGRDGSHRRKFSRRAPHQSLLRVHREPLSQLGHHRLRGRQLLPGQPGNAGTDGGLPPQVALRRGFHSGARDRNGVSRRSGRQSLRALDRGARARGHHGGLRRRQLLPGQSRDAPADGDFSSQDEERRGLCASERSRPLRGRHRLPEHGLQLHRGPL